MVFILCDLVQSTLTHISKKPTSVVETWIYGKCIYNMHADHINTCCLAALCVLEIHLVFKRYVEKSTDKQKIYIYLIFYKFIFCCWCVAGFFVIWNGNCSEYVGVGVSVLPVGGEQSSSFDDKTAENETVCYGLHMEKLLQKRWRCNNHSEKWRKQKIRSVNCNLFTYSL